MTFVTNKLINHKLLRATYQQQNKCHTKASPQSFCALTALGHLTERRRVSPATAVTPYNNSQQPLPDGVMCVSVCECFPNRMGPPTISQTDSFTPTHNSHLGVMRAAPVRTLAAAHEAYDNVGDGSGRRRWWWRRQHSRRHRHRQRGNWAHIIGLWLRLAVLRHFVVVVVERRAAALGGWRAMGSKADVAHLKATTSSNRRHRRRRGRCCSCAGRAPVSTPCAHFRSRCNNYYFLVDFVVAAAAAAAAADVVALPFLRCMLPHAPCLCFGS